MTTAEWRKRLKEAHLCRDCKKQDAYTLGGRTYCAECAEKLAAKKREYREGHKAQAKEQQQKSKAKRIERGVCIYCGRHKPKPGNLVCDICNSRTHAKRRERRIADGMNWPRGANGYCWQCNKAKAVEGKRLCPECLAMKRRYLTPEAGERGRETQRRRLAERGFVPNIGGFVRP